LQIDQNYIVAYAYDILPGYKYAVAAFKAFEKLGVAGRDKPDYLSAAMHANIYDSPQLLAVAYVYDHLFAQFAKGIIYAVHKKNPLLSILWQRGDF
jgi:hypothetical protein